VDGSNITGAVTADGSHTSNNAPDLRVSGSEVSGSVSTRLGATVKCVASYSSSANATVPTTSTSTGCTPTASARRGSPTRPGVNLSPAWSADGTKIAFTNAAAFGAPGAGLPARLAATALKREP
jgi:hypothetical protein